MGEDGLGPNAQAKEKGGGRWGVGEKEEEEEKKRMGGGGAGGGFLIVLPLIRVVSSSVVAQPVVWKTCRNTPESVRES